MLLEAIICHFVNSVPIMLGSYIGAANRTGMSTAPEEFFSVQNTDGRLYGFYLYQRPPP